MLYFTISIFNIYFHNDNLLYFVDGHDELNLNFEFYALGGNNNILYITSIFSQNNDFRNPSSKKAFF